MSDYFVVSTEFYLSEKRIDPLVYVAYTCPDQCLDACIEEAMRRNKKTLATNRSCVYAFVAYASMTNRSQSSVLANISGLAGSALRNFARFSQYRNFPDDERNFWVIECQTENTDFFYNAEGDFWGPIWTATTYPEDRKEKYEQELGYWRKLQEVANEML